MLAVGLRKFEPENPSFQLPNLALLKASPAATTMTSMRLPLRRCPRLFRSFLVLGLLAWAAFVVEAVAHPVGMVAAAAAQVSAATGKAFCEGMPAMHTVAPASQHTAPGHSPDNGHGCCEHGGCYCASLCSGIVGVPYLGLEMQPTHAFAFPLIYSQPVRALSAPPLRPPIA